MDGEGHVFKIRGLICRGGTEGCDDKLAKAVFKDVDDDVPFTNDDQTTGPRRLLGLFPIRHEADEDELESINKTSFGHPFHEGTVTHRVDWPKGDLHYEVIGRGDGSLSRFNNLLGIHLFLPGVYRVVQKHGLP